MPNALLGWLGTSILCVVATAASVSDNQPDFSGDLFLVGRWSCDAKREGRSPAQEDAVYSWGLGGRWLKLSYTLHPSEPGVGPTTTEAYETFDTALKEWVYVSLSSDGSYGTSYSEGWQGNVKVYRPPSGDPQQFRFIATRVSDGEFTEVAEVPSGSGWRTTFSLQCRKIGANPP